MKTSSANIIAQLRDQNARLFAQVRELNRISGDLQRENTELRRLAMEKCWLPIHSDNAQIAVDHDNR